jgi:hypothetical protein
MEDYKYENIKRAFYKFWNPPAGGAENLPRKPFSHAESRL